MVRKPLDPNIALFRGKGMAKMYNHRARISGFQGFPGFAVLCVLHDSWLDFKFHVGCVRGRFSVECWTLRISPCFVDPVSKSPFGKARVFGFSPFRTGNLSN